MAIVVMRAFGDDACVDDDATITTLAAGIGQDINGCVDVGGFCEHNTSACGAA